jgi:hypothetical protein
MSLESLPSAGMNEAERRSALDTVDDLRAFVQAGGRIEWSEPPIRGRKGPDHSAVRFVSIHILNPGRYDKLCWDRVRERLRQGGC